MHLVSSEFCWFVGGVGQHLGSYPRISKVNSAALWSFETNIIDAAKVTIGVEVSPVGSAWRADIDPSLMIENQIGFEFL